MKRKTKNTGSTVLGQIAQTQTVASAQIIANGNCGSNENPGSVTWSLDVSGVLTIIGTGEMRKPESSLWNDKKNLIKSAVIHFGVTSIGENAFNLCYRLKNITIPDSVTNIGESAFRWCGSLRNITIGSGVTTIGRNAFYDCGSLESLTIPNRVTSIGERTFKDCSDLVSIKIPDSVTSIEDEVFSGCENLISITIGSGVKSIKHGAFSGCHKFSSITVAPANSVYSSEDGVLFNKDKTVLIFYPTRKKNLNYQIPGTVTRIEKAAFQNCVCLANVIIPDSVKSIGETAFYAYGSL
jgi:hypothetical protein